MNLHEFKELDFEEALDLLETRLVELKGSIEEAEKKGGASSAVRNELVSLRRQQKDVEANMARLRSMKAAELAGEKDNLLTETFMIFDQLGERIDRLLERV